MKEFAEKGFYVGLGLAALTKDKIEEIARDVATRAKMSEEQGRQLAESLQTEGRKAREHLGTTVDELVQKTLKHMPWSQKMADLERRVAALEVALAARAAQEKTE